MLKKETSFEIQVLQSSLSRDQINCTWKPVVAWEIILCDLNDSKINIKFNWLT